MLEIKHFQENFKFEKIPYTTAGFHRETINITALVSNGLRDLRQSANFVDQQQADARRESLSGI